MKNSIRHATMAALVALAVAPAPASAQRSPTGAERAANERLSRAIARSLHDRASAYFKAGKMELALEEFLEVRRFLQRPEIDYNIAKCYEKLGRYAEATVAYKRYLELRK